MVGQPQKRKKMSFGTVWTRTHDPEIKMDGDE